MQPLWSLDLVSQPCIQVRVFSLLCSCTNSLAFIMMRGWGMVASFLKKETGGVALKQKNEATWRLLIILTRYDFYCPSSHGSSNGKTDYMMIKSRNRLVPGSYGWNDCDNDAPQHIRRVRRLQFIALAALVICPCRCW